MKQWQWYFMNYRLRLMQLFAQISKQSKSKVTELIHISMTVYRWYHASPANNSTQSWVATKFRVGCLVLPTFKESHVGILTKPPVPSSQKMKMHPSIKSHQKPCSGRSQRGASSKESMASAMGPGVWTEIWRPKRRHFLEGPRETLTSTIPNSGGWGAKLKLLNTVRLSRAQRVFYCSQTTSKCFLYPSLLLKVFLKLKSMPWYLKLGIVSITSCLWFVIWSTGPFLQHSLTLALELWCPSLPLSGMRMEKQVEQHWTLIRFSPVMDSEGESHILDMSLC